MSSSAIRTSPSVSPIALGLTLERGQVFHWKKDAHARWHGLIGDVPVTVAEGDGSLLVQPGQEALVSKYFSLDHPLEEIYAQFPNDPASRESLQMCRGLRIIRQPRWECLATFITSSMKQVAHIRAMSLALRKKFGRPVSGSDVEAYPAPGVLAAASESDSSTAQGMQRGEDFLQGANLSKQVRFQIWSDCSDVLRHIIPRNLCAHSIHPRLHLPDRRTAANSAG